MASNSRRSSGRRAASLVLVLAVLPGAVHGCSAPTRPPDPPSGGQDLHLSFERFQSDVSPVLERRGCSAGGDCHGGGIRGSFELSPPGAKDVRFDFEQARLQVSPAAPDSSPILTEPLAIAAGGTPHAFKPFASVADTEWIVIRAWVEDGAAR